MRYPAINLALVILTLPFILYSFPQLMGASETYVMVSGSMAPEIDTGSVVFVEEKDIEEVDKGDIVSFYEPGGNSSVVTHRVVENSGNSLKTKGDVNPGPDPFEVSEKHLIGKKTFSIPLFGHLLLTIGSGPGIIVFVVVPGTMVVLMEIRRLRDELN